MADDVLNQAPREQPIADSSAGITYEWDRWFYNIYSSVNSVSASSFNDNLLLNGNFNYPDNLSVTQVDGDGAYIAEKWQVNGATTSEYEITSQEYTPAFPFATSSARYQNVNITQNDGDFYIYQQLDGLSHVMSVNRRNLAFSGVFNNKTQNDVAVKVAIYRYFDTEDSLALSRSVMLKPGFNTVRSLISKESLSTNISSVGASPYLQVRIYLERFDDAAHVAIHHLKLETGAVVTREHTDNALERIRIDNS